MSYKKRQAVGIMELIAGRSRQVMQAGLVQAFPVAFCTDCGIRSLRCTTLGTRVRRLQVTVKNANIEDIEHIAREALEKLKQGEGLESAKQHAAGLKQALLERMR